LEYSNEALHIEETLDKYHPSLATSYNNIAAIYDDMNNYNKSLEYYKKSLYILEKVLGEEHFYTAITYSNIAKVFMMQNYFKEALDWYLKAFPTIINVLGVEHHKTEGIFYNIATAYEESEITEPFWEWLRKNLPENCWVNLINEISKEKESEIKKCPEGHFYQQDKTECPHCIANSQIEQQIDTYINALLEAYSSAYKKKELQKITNLDSLVGQYGYIFHKASKFLLVGTDEYGYNDYFHYPLVEWNQEKLKNGCEQFAQAKGVTEQQCLENLTQEEIRDLFELFHYTLIKVESSQKEGVSKIIFRHKVEEKECFVFCQLKL